MDAVKPSITRPTLILNCCREGGACSLESYFGREQHDWAGQGKRQESAAGSGSRQVGFAKLIAAPFYYMYVIVSRSSSRSGDDVSDSSLSSGDEDTTSAPSGVRPIPSAGTGDHWRRVVLMLSDRGIGLGNVSNCLVQQVVLGVGEDEVVWQDLLVRLLARRDQGTGWFF